MGLPAGAQMLFLRLGPLLPGPDTDAEPSRRPSHTQLVVRSLGSLGAACTLRALPGLVLRTALEGGGIWGLGSRDPWSSCQR